MTAAAAPVCPTCGATLVIPVAIRDELTTRQREVLVLLVTTHLTLKQMAARMVLSFHTVKAYTRAVYRKVGVGSRAELIQAIARAAATTSSTDTRQPPTTPAGNPPMPLNEKGN